MAGSINQKIALASPMAVRTVPVPSPSSKAVGKTITFNVLAAIPRPPPPAKGGTRNLGNYPSNTQGSHRPILNPNRGMRKTRSPCITHHASRSLRSCVSTNLGPNSRATASCPHCVLYVSLFFVFRHIFYSLLCISSTSLCPYKIRNANTPNEKKPPLFWAHQCFFKAYFFPINYG